MNRAKRNGLFFERLEDRRVLAGNVHAMISEGILMVVGDSQSNQVEIAQDNAGRFVVTGVDTTVNGQEGPQVINGGVSHVTVSLRDGNDEVTVNAINVPSNFSFYGGNGNDRLVTNGLNAWHFHAEGQPGDDVFELDMAIARSAYLYLGAGNDVVSSESLSAGRNLKIFGHAGNDTVSTNRLQVSRKLEIHMDQGDDNVVMSGQTRVGRYAMLNLGQGNDFAAVLPGTNGEQASFRELRISGESGNDNVALDQNVRSSRRLLADGGSGSNILQAGGADFPGIRSQNFANGPIPNLDALINNVMEQLAAAGIGEDPVVIPFTASASPGSFNFVENGSPGLVDPAFVLEGSENVTRVTVQIGNFQAGSEQLLVDETANIRGDFDSTSGLLTLTGNASTAEYQQVIRSIRFENTSDNPNAGSRTFDYTIVGASEVLTTTRNFLILAVNDAPSVIPSNDNQVILPEDLPVAVDSQLAVSDVDSDNLTMATVSIVTGRQTGDTLSVIEGAGITSEFNEVTGVLTLVGDASVANWQSVLRTVTLENTEASIPVGQRTIRFVVNDESAAAVGEVLIDVQVAQQPNVFEVSQGDANGSVVGRVTMDGSFQTPMIYQFNDDQVPNDVLLNADDHISGNQQASVVLIEYFSFQCPACATNHLLIKQLEADFPDDLIVVRRHQPLEAFFDNARAAAIAAEAAGRQGMFEEMADVLFANQSEWSGVLDPTSLFESYATSIGLNLNHFQSDVLDPDLDARVTRDADEAFGLGISSTPSFILQNEPLANPGTQEGFNQAIQNALDSLTSPFAIDRQTGDILLRDNTLLDATNSPVLNLSVLVVDASGNSELIDVTVNVSP